MFEQLKTFIDANKRKPLTVSNIPEEKKLGCWLSCQKQHYKNKTQGMKDDGRYNLWTQFLEDYKAHILTSEEIWYKNFEQAKTFMDINKQKPDWNTTNPKEKCIRIWLNTQQHDYKDKTGGMKDDNRYKLWTQLLEDYNEYISTNDDLWVQNFEELKTFIDANQRKPSHKHTEEFQLNKWLSHQQENYKKKTHSMKDETQYNLWSQFLEDYKDYFVTNVDIWCQKFEELKMFISTNKRGPLISSKIPDETQLSCWVYCQQRNYKNKTDGMKDVVRYNLWTKFLEEYKEYFVSEDEIWFQRFEELKMFIDTSKRTPTHHSNTPEERYLGKWLSHQVTNYKNKINGMKDITRYNLWSQFLEDYNEYFVSNEELWLQDFEELKSYIDVNKSRPTAMSKNQEDTKLCRFICYNQRNYKNKTKGMKDEVRYNLWTHFLEEYKEYFNKPTCANEDEPITESTEVIKIIQKEDNTNAVYCEMNKTNEIVNVKSKWCIYLECRTIPIYNNKGETKGLYCSTHKLDGMVDVVNKKCAHEGCSVTPNYNIEGQKKGLYCSTHKLDKMINVTSNACAHVGCKTRPHYNVEGETTGLYCSPHKKDGMVNVRSKICAHEGCKVIPNYNLEGESTGLYCSPHKKEGMVNVKSKTCIQEGCKVIPNYNVEGQTNALYCFTHKKNGMINVKDKKCCYEGCNVIPNYNIEGSKHGLYCVQHKKKEMIDVKNKKCIYPNCNTHANYNVEGNKNSLYCSAHKLDGMVNVTGKTCNSDWCSTIVSNEKYDGYCLFCYMHLFPDKPVSRNYKTKEYAVVEYVKMHFPNFDWKADKIVNGGCSKRRPDLLLDLGYQVIIIEVDENQHIDYDCSCENKRIMELSQDVGHRPIVFIRFNPDEYTKNGKNITSCWGQDKKGICVVKKIKKDEWLHRLTALQEQINYWIHPEHITNKTIETIQLFYNE